MSFSNNLQTPEFKSENEYQNQPNQSEIINHLKRENKNLVNNIKQLNKYVEFLNNKQ